LKNENYEYVMNMTTTINNATVNNINNILRLWYYSWARSCSSYI